MIGRGALCAAAGLLALAGAAQAGECGNPCDLPAGGVCTSLLRKGEGYARGPVRLGDALRLHIGQQRGTCGGLEDLAGQVVVRSARAPQGPFTPLGTATDEGRPLWRPTEAGAYFLVVTPAAPERPKAEERVFVAVEEGAAVPVKLRLKGVPRGGWLWVWRAPPQPEAALLAGFLRQRWPVLYQGAAPRDGLALKVAPGPLALEWSRMQGQQRDRAEAAVVVTGAGAQTVVLAPARSSAAMQR